MEHNKTALFPFTERLLDTAVGLGIYKDIESHWINVVYSKCDEALSEFVLETLLKHIKAYKPERPKKKRSEVESFDRLALHLYKPLYDDLILRGHIKEAQGIQDIILPLLQNGTDPQISPKKLEKNAIKSAKDVLVGVYGLSDKDSTLISRGIYSK